jgi:hypothetical protein
MDLHDEGDGATYGLTEVWPCKRVCCAPYEQEQGVAGISCVQNTCQLCTASFLQACCYWGLYEGTRDGPGPNRI